MNRLILLGNGFDLAHGLKTSYNDFIKWYFKKCLQSTWGVQPFEDELMYVKKVEYYFAQVNQEELDIYIDLLYRQSLLDCENEYIFEEATSSHFRNPFNIKIKFIKDAFQQVLL
ncbi:hypothetical protein D3C87_1604890 [compost metagenome]